MAIIGIDLGTTTSEVAIYKDNRTILIPNIQEDNSTIIPSIVLIEKDSIKVGIKAKNQMIIKAVNTVIEFKRFIGTEKTYNIDDKKYTSIDIATMILKKIKLLAEFYMGEEVEEAVITVPANFNDIQRNSIKDAGKLAGLRVERIINEPTAAAIAYGLDKLHENMNILVYDFGGGTVDVTVLELFEGVLNVKASRGNDSLGGSDIDKLLIRFIIEEFYEKNEVMIDLNDVKILSTLKNACEECKKELSTSEKYDIAIPHIVKTEEGKILDLDITISRKLLEQLIAPILKETDELITAALRASNIGDNGVDKIIMVGGTTRIPAVRKLLSSRFGVNKICSGINPEEVVAAGAAIQGAIKQGSIKNIVVADAVSHSLGVEILGNKFDKIIMRDSKVPISITKIYKTVEDNQNDVEIRVYQGESEDIEENTFIDSFEINNIPHSKKGDERIEVSFKYDINGILGVRAKVLSTGHEKAIDIIRKSTLDNEKKIESNFIIDTSGISEVIEDYDVVRRENIEEYTVNEVNNEEHVNNNMDTFNTYNNDVEEIREEEVQVIEDDEDYTNIYEEVVGLINYINAVLPSYAKREQEEATEIMREMVTAIKSDEYKKVRILEHKIVELLGIGE